MTSSPTPLLNAEQRAWQYWFDDGLPTLVAGVGCLLAAVFFAYDESRNATPLTIAVTFIALLLYVAVLLFHRYVLDWLKTKITYPRTGYVQPPYFAEEASAPLETVSLSLQGADAKRSSDIERLHTYRKQRLMFLCVVVAMATIAMMFVQNRWICALAGILMAVALWTWGRKVQRLSWVILGGFPFVGFYMTLFQAHRVVGVRRVAYFLAGAGVVLILDGALTLLRYLRVNPRPKPTES